MATTPVADGWSGSTAQPTRNAPLPTPTLWSKFPNGGCWGAGAGAGAGGGAPPAIENRVDRRSRPDAITALIAERSWLPVMVADPVVPLMAMVARSTRPDPPRPPV